MKRKFIVNPSAGGAENGIQAVKDFLRARRIEASFVITKSREHAIEETRAAISAGYEQIVALGGDGTVNAVANGFFGADGNLLSENASLGVAEMGTGCDYFRTVMGPGAKISWMEVLLDPRIRKVDVGALRIESQSETFFVNMASVGATAEILKRKETLPSWIPRRSSYFVSTLLELPRLKPIKVTVEIDGERRDYDLLALFISKGTYAGGGMKFGGKVGIDDGFFEVTLVEKMPLKGILPNLRHLYSGEMERVPGIHKFMARQISLFSSERGDKGLVETDGEIMGQIPARFSIRPKLLPVCFPNL